MTNITITDLQIINLTPHSIRLRTEIGNRTPSPLDSDIIIMPSGIVTRIATKNNNRTTINDAIHITETTYTGILDMPDPQPNTIYLVSSLVAARYQRDDLYAPRTDATAIRANGEIFAVTGLQQFTSEV